MYSAQHGKWIDPLWWELQGFLSTHLIPFIPWKCILFPLWTCPKIQEACPLPPFPLQVSGVSLGWSSSLAWGCLGLWGHFLALPICFVVVFFLSNSRRPRRSLQGSCPPVPDCSMEQLRSHSVSGVFPWLQRQLLASHFSGPNAPRYFANPLIRTGELDCKSFSFPNLSSLF